MRFAQKEKRLATKSLVSATLLLLCVHAAQAGRPLTIDDSEPVEPGSLELEAGLKYSSGSSMTHFDFPFGATTGIVPGLELGVGFGGILEEREETTTGDDTVSGFGDLVVSSKYKFADAARWWASQALALTVKFPTAGSDLGTGEIDYDAMWIATRPIGERCNAHWNIGYSWIGDRSDENFDDVLHYGVAVDYQIAPAWQFVAEIAANTPVGDEDETGVFWNAGARWILGNWTFDAALGSRITGDVADFTATIGLTTLFDFNR